MDKKKLIIGLLLVVAILFGPSYYRKFINNKTIENSDIVGEWKGSIPDITLSPDGSIAPSGSSAFHGEWEIVSTDRQLVRIKLFMTDEDYKKASDNYGGWDDLEPSNEELHEMVFEELFEEKIFRYIRTEDKLYSVEDEDVTTWADEDGENYENDCVLRHVN